MTLLQQVLQDLRAGRWNAAHDLVQKDGSMLKVKRLVLPGMDKPFQPDAGWDYNPAADYHGSNQ